MPDDDARARLIATRASVPTSSLARLWRAGRGALGVTRVLRQGRRGDALDAEQLAEIVATLGGLKGVAMKAGQMLSYVYQTLPSELRDALAVLQTAAPAMDFEAVAAVVRAALGPRADAL